MRLLCTCIALFTLACQGAPATDASKPAPAPTPAKPDADKAAPAKAEPANPHAAGPTAAPIVRPPVNPTPVTPSGKVRAETVAGLSFSVPTEWISKPGSNPMRLAELTLPGPGGEVVLVVSRFAGGGGDLASNINRWKTQFVRADGGPIAEAGEKTTERAPLKVTTVDIKGTNIAAVTPGASERYNESDSRLLGVIVEGLGDPFFFKAVGPATTLDVWEPAFKTFADSLAVAK